MFSLANGLRVVSIVALQDACNRKSNQQNVGTIKCSNLCTEIVEYSSPTEVAVCNLASIALNRFVTTEKTFDFKKLHEVFLTLIGDVCAFLS